MVSQKNDSGVPVYPAQEKSRLTIVAEQLKLHTTTGGSVGGPLGTEGEAGLQEVGLLVDFEFPMRVPPASA